MSTKLGNNNKYFKCYKATMPHSLSKLIFELKLKSLVSLARSQRLSQAKSYHAWNHESSKLIGQNIMTIEHIGYIF
jgi:hypothetical protein